MSLTSEVLSASTTCHAHHVVARIAYWSEGRAGSPAAEENASNIACGPRAADACEMNTHDIRGMGGDFTPDKEQTSGFDSSWHTKINQR